MSEVRLFVSDSSAIKFFVPENEVADSAVLMQYGRKVLTCCAYTRTFNPGGQEQRWFAGVQISPTAWVRG